MTKTLLDRHRNGEAITLIRKIEAETSLVELNAMQKAIGERGEDLTIQELQAFARRRAELRKIEERRTK